MTGIFSKLDANDSPSATLFEIFLICFRKKLLDTVSAEISIALIIAMLLDLKMLKEFVNLDRSESIKEFLTIGTAKSNLSNFKRNNSNPIILIERSPINPLINIAK